MINILKVGRLFYGFGIIAYGLQQLVIGDFRPQIVAAFPEWAHTNLVFPLVTGIGMLVAGVAVSGIGGVTIRFRRQISFLLGVYFSALLLLSHIPYLLFVYPHKLSHLGSWGDALKGLAFAGSSFIVAASFQSDASDNKHRSALQLMNTIGRVFFCTTIILFGCNHFVYDLSPMVPAWMGMGVFWSNVGGAALVGAGLAILLQILVRPIAQLLALMLFLWFVMLHVPGAIADPYAGRGNLIVSAFDALLFCGTALVISQFIQSEKFKIK